MRPHLFSLVSVGDEMTPSVKDMVELLGAIAPRRLAESWDNVGLQAGDPGWPVESAWVALDPLPAVVDAACQAGVQLLITHHPLIFKPLSTIDFSSDTGLIISRCARHRLAILSAHTNLDSAPGGLNDIAAGLCGLVDLRPMLPAPGDDTVKLVVFVPEGYEGNVVRAIEKTPAGRIGSYSGCTFRAPGTGTFTPGQDARPFTGVPGTASHVAEYRLEVVTARRHLDEVVGQIRSVHPYEAMAYDVYPLTLPAADYGMGRVGRLEKPLPLARLAGALLEKFGAAGLRVVGEPEQMIRTAAVCTGSGGSLLGDFFRSGADVYITGDVRYHEARSIEMAGKALIDLGHFASEIIFARPLAEQLTEAAGRLGFHVTITHCQIETDPFRFHTGRQDR